MTETISLNSREMAILHAAYRNGCNYQPDASQLETANRLYDRGLLQKAADFGAVTVLTDAGESAYHAEIDRLCGVHGDDWLARHYA